MSHFTMGGAALLQDEATLPSFGASTTSKQERELMSQYKAMLDSIKPESNTLQWEQKPAMADAKRKHIADMDAPIPKKPKPTTTMETITARPKDTPASHESRSISNRDRGSLVPNQFYGNPTATGKEFSVVFDSRTALGFYCVTNQDKQQASYCKIISVCPHASKNKNNLVQPGVVAVAAQVHGQAKVTVTAHADLMASYERAQERGLPITIAFTNGFVASEAAQGTHRFALQWWTLDGQWVGKCKRGWDGGASVVWEPCSILKVANTLPTPAADKSGLTKKAVQFTEKLRFREFTGTEGEDMVNFSGKQFGQRGTRVKLPGSKARGETFQQLGSVLTYLGNSFYGRVANKVQVLAVHRGLVAKAVANANVDTNLQELQLIDSILTFRLEAACLLRELKEKQYRKCVDIRIVSIQGADVIPGTVHSRAQLEAEVLLVHEVRGFDAGVDTIASTPPTPLSNCDGLDCPVKQCVIDYNSRQAHLKELVFCLSVGEGDSCLHQEVSVPFDALVKLSQTGPSSHDFVTEKHNGVSIQLSVSQVPCVLSKEQEAMFKRVSHLVATMDTMNLDIGKWNKENGRRLKPFAVDQVLFQGQSLLDAAILGMDPASLKSFLHQDHCKLGHKALSSSLSLAKDLQRYKPTLLNDRKKQDGCLQDMVRWLSHAISRAKGRSKVAKTSQDNWEAVDRAAQVTDSPESKKPVLDINDLH